MKRLIWHFVASIGPYVMILLLCLSVSGQTTAFSYQGFVKHEGLPATGMYDLEFRLFAIVSGGSPLGSVQRPNVSIEQGIISVTLDYGVFPTSDRYLEIAIRPTGTPAFQTLSPRSQILASPYATLAYQAISASFAANSANSSSALTLAGIGPDGFIRNASQTQQSGNFNVNGTGSANVLNADSQYRIGGERVIGVNGFQNLFVGTRAGNLNNSGTENTFVGIDAGLGNRAASGNSFFGAEAGLSNQGSLNSFFGSDSGKNNAGAGNSFVGYRSGVGNTTGSGNSFYGANTAIWNSTGSNNSFFGSNSGFFNTAGSNNVFYGSSSGKDNETGAQNSFIGSESGMANRTGNQNTFVGYTAGMFNFFGSNNTLVGAFSTVGGGSLTNATAIGHRAQVNRDNSLVLGGITGVNLGSDTNVGIGTTMPKAKLHIAGGNLYLANPQTLIMTSPNGACWAVAVADNGSLSAVSMPCPQ